jgi:carbamoyl-phosphate synthase large subunit
MPLLTGDHYTVGCLNLGDTPHVVPIRRDSFTPGVTWAGQVVHETAVIARVTRVAKALDLGPCVNVQLAWDGDAPGIYEINPRLSTTSSVCAAAGLNLADALLHHSQGRAFMPGSIAWGLRFSRYAADLIDQEG